MAKQRSDLLTVQALRGIAALMVVAFHAVNVWSEHILGSTADKVWPNGSGGVDIFFVISGLVMVISADRVTGRPGAWRIFWWQRIIRIVPIYWIMTTAKVVAVLVLPAHSVETRLNLPYVVGSYLFLPVRNWLGETVPVLPVGWTLSYEMLFYALVAIALALRAPIFAIAGPALGSLVLAAVAGGDGFANTIVVEFLFGVLIGSGIKYGTQIPLFVAAPMLALGVVIILVGPVISGVLRPIAWGIPAACIVAGAVALEEQLSSIIPRWMLDTGDASYSIYLMHPFVVPIVFIAVTRAVPPTLWLPVTILVSLLSSAGIGRLGFVWIERPLLRLLRRQPVAPTVATAG